MDIKFFLTIKIPQHARIAIDFSKRQNQYGNYKASHTTGNTSQPSTHVLPSFRTVFCGHFHSDWKLQKNEATTKLQKKMRCDRQSAKKKRCDRQSVKKAMERAKCKKNAMWQTQCKKKRCERQSVKKKRWDGQSAKKKRWNGQSAKKMQLGSLLCLAFGKGSQQDETTKPRLAALFFCVFVCGSVYSSASEAMIRTARRVQYSVFFYMPTQNTTDAWLTFFFSSLWEKEKKGTHLKNGSPYKSVVLAGPAYRRSWNWPCVKKRKMKVAFF